MPEEIKSKLRYILLCHIGRERAVKAEALMAIFGYEDDRTIRKAIEELIDTGFPICSAVEEPAGYFFPAGVDEARIYSKSLQRRAVRIFLRRRHIIRNTACWYERARQLEMV